MTTAEPGVPMSPVPLVQRALGLVLDAKHDGTAYLNAWNGGELQQWRLIESRAGDAEPIFPDLCSFMHLAMRVELGRVAPDDHAARNAIVKRVKAIRTRGEAERYVLTIDAQLRGAGTREPAPV